MMSYILLNLKGVAPAGRMDIQKEQDTLQAADECDDLGIYQHVMIMCTLYPLKCIPVHFQQRNDIWKLSY